MNLSGHRASVWYRSGFGSWSLRMTNASPGCSWLSLRKMTSWRPPCGRARTSSSSGAADDGGSVWSDMGLLTGLLREAVSTRVVFTTDSRETTSYAPRADRLPRAPGAVRRQPGRRTRGPAGQHGGAGRPGHLRAGGSAREHRAIPPRTAHGGGPRRELGAGTVHARPSAPALPGLRDDGARAGGLLQAPRRHPGERHRRERPGTQPAGCRGRPALGPPDRPGQRGGRRPHRRRPRDGPHRRAARRGRVRPDDQRRHQPRVHSAGSQHPHRDRAAPLPLPRRRAGAQRGRLRRAPRSHAGCLGADARPSRLDPPRTVRPPRGLPRAPRAGRHQQHRGSGMSRDLLSVTRLLGPGTEAAQLREQLRDVIDPELGIDIVSLGLVYGLEVNGRVAAVVITTTTPACPLGEYITDEVRRVLLESGAVDHVEVVITHAPAWTPEMMSDETKQAFGW